MMENSGTMKDENSYGTVDATYINEYNCIHHYIIIFIANENIKVLLLHSSNSKKNGSTENNTYFFKRF